jgi:hypothetical protein
MHLRRDPGRRAFARLAAAAHAARYDRLPHAAAAGFEATERPVESKFRHNIIPELVVIGITTSPDHHHPTATSDRSVS